MRYTSGTPPWLLALLGWPLATTPSPSDVQLRYFAAFDCAAPALGPPLDINGSGCTSSDARFGVELFYGFAGQTS